jgi:hypothetical protein
MCYRSKLEFIEDIDKELTGTKKQNNKTIVAKNNCSIADPLDGSITDQRR